MRQFARQGKNPRSHRGANANHYRHKQAHISPETYLFRHKRMLPASRTIYEQVDLKTLSQKEFSEVIYRADELIMKPFSRYRKGLPDDIAILDIVLMDNRGHARFDATKRTYNYFAHFRKSPFLEDVSGFYLLENLDFKKIKQAVDLFTKYDDYYAFCRRADSYKHTICDVSVSNLYVNESQTRMRFEVSANRFL